MVSSIGWSLYHGCVLGGYVERPVNSIVNHFFREPHSEMTPLYKSAIKLTTIWLGITLTPATAAAFTNVLKLGAVTFISLALFARPLLYSLHDFNREIPSNMETWKKVAIIVTWLAAASLEAGFIVGMSSISTPWVIYTVAGLLVSNLLVGGGLYLTAAFAANNEEEIRIDPPSPLMSECEQLSSEIAELKSKIEKLDHFVRSHPDLLRITLEYIEKYKEYIAVIPSGVDAIQVEGPNDYIGLRGSLRQEKIRQEHELRERLIFIETHPEVFQVFKSSFETERSRQESTE